MLEKPMEIDPAALLATDRRLRALARELVGEAAGADDLAQETWLASLQDPAAIESFPAWLAAVARRLAGRSRRAGARRSGREERAARAEAIPSTADILQREEARQRVVAAVLALEEPLRTTLVLRFLEDLPPRAVAARMAVPVETVRTRTRRGLETLRGRLDSDFGDRERWLPAVLVLARAPSPGPTILAASIHTKVAASLTVLALLAWILWPRGRDPGPSAPIPIAQVAEQRELSRPLASEVADPAGKARTEASTAIPAAPAGSESFGGLRVVVRWDSPEPASGLCVRVTSDERENAELDALEGFTDVQGTAHFERVPAGTARVWVDRHFGPPRAVAISLGATAEVEFRLPHGFDIAGVVEDELGRAVADAEVRLGKYPDLAHGALVARSADDGSFRVLAVTHACLGARAAGFGPSKIEHIFSAPGSVVKARLVLRNGGGEVVGSVRGPFGAPVPGALVRVGPPGPASLTSENSIDADWGAITRSDEQGRFRVQGVASGTCPIVVRGAGFALLRGEVEVPAGGRAAFEASLLPEAALEGRVLDALGAPVSGAAVLVGEEVGPFRAASRTRAEGTFRVGALEADRELEAWIEDERGSARIRFLSRSGGIETWEAVLVQAGDIRGRVVDQRGEPLASWAVRLQSEDPPADDPDEMLRHTGTDGRFAFEGVRDWPHLLTVTARGATASSLLRFGVHPSRDEIVLRVTDGRIPSARIVGAVLDEQGRAVPTAQLVPMTDDSYFIALGTCDPDTGRFALGPFPAGRVRLSVRTPQRGDIVFEPHELVADETWDVGEIRLAPEGRLRVRLVPAGLEASAAIELSLDGQPFPEPAFGGTGVERLSPPLAPGSHTLRLGGGSCEELALPFEIRSRAETVIDVPLRRGWRTAVAVRAPDSAWVELSLRGPGGLLLERRMWEREGELITGTLHLQAGEYFVEAAAGGRRARGTLIVEANDRDGPALVLSIE
jgi:RNA polymerase sigma-70 factor (ECF subfamily)